MKNKLRMQLLKKIIKKYMQNKTNQTIEFYRTVLVGLENGYDMIKHYLQTEQGRSNTMQLIDSTQVPILTLVGNVYPVDIYPSLDEQQQRLTRTHLLSRLYHHLRDAGFCPMVEGLFVLVGKLHDQEGYQSWTPLYLDLTESIWQQCPTIIGEFMLRILHEADTRVQCLSRHFLQFTIQHHQHFPPPTLMQILYHCTRSMIHLVGTDTQTLQTYYNKHQQHIINYAWQHMKVNIHTMLYALKLLTVAFTDLQLGSQVEYVVKALPELCTQLGNQYLMELEKSSHGYQLEDDDVTMGQVMYQMMELVESVLVNYQDEVHLEPVIVTYLLCAMIEHCTYTYWHTHTIDYYIAFQSEMERTVRNRAVHALTTLITQHPQQASHKQIILSHLTHTVESINSNNYSWLHNKLSPLGLTFPESLLPELQQSTYFLLYYLRQQVLSEEQLQSLLEFLCGRVKKTESVLVRMSCLMIIVDGSRQFGVPFLRFLFEVGWEDVGLWLVLGKGVGKCCMKGRLVMDKDVPVEFVRYGVRNIVMDSEIDHDATHIVLDLLGRLLKVEDNLYALKQIITLQVQHQLLTYFAHDGLLCSMIVKIVGVLSNPTLLQQLCSALFNGNIQHEFYVDIILCWIDTSLITLDEQHIFALLNKYTGGKKGIVSRVVKRYLERLEGRVVSAELGNLLCGAADASWYILLLQNKIVSDAEGMLNSSINQLSNQITSPYQFEKALTLPFYLGLYTLPQLFAHLPQQFIQKLLRYSELFKGEHLRIVTGHFLIRMVEAQPQYRGKVIKILEGYGKMQVDEWVECENESDQEDQLDRIISAQVVNEEVQQEFQKVFKDIAWNSQFVRESLYHLKL